MTAARVSKDGLRLVGFLAARGAAVAGVIGAVAGLVIGLLVDPATAVFAMVELGIPATLVGGVVGLLAALVILATRRSRLH